MDAETFFKLLRAGDVSCLVDIRESRQYKGARFTDERDLRYVCGLHGVRYLVMEELAPEKRWRVMLWDEFLGEKSASRRNPRAWTIYLHEYYKTLLARDVLREGSPLRELVDGPSRSAAFLCACAHPDDCHRRVLAHFIAANVSGVTIDHLTPDRVGGKAPMLRSPRCYLLEPITAIGVPANLPRRSS
jgi:hypothetical protein